MCMRRRLGLGVEAPQRRFRIDTLADAVDVEGVIVTMRGEGTAAVRAEAVTIVLFKRMGWCAVVGL
jgi:hypothetical protein